MLLRYLTGVLLLGVVLAGIVVDKTGCGQTKGCLFKPAGCDPNLDCTIGLVFHVVGPNQLRVQLVAQSIIPPEALQYVAIAFSKDQIMGDDFVTECVVQTRGDFAGIGSEVFLSHNDGKANDRIYISPEDKKQLISNVSSEFTDGRLICDFTQQIVPQVVTKKAEIWDLNQEFFIMGATGKALPDEIIAHDTNRGSHFFPIVSSRQINPSLVGEHQWPLPQRPASAEPAEEPHPNEVTHSNDSPPPMEDHSGHNHKETAASSASLFTSFALLFLSYVLL